MRDLTGKVALVTGAARGLGAELTRRLNARGATVALVGLEPELMQQVAEGLAHPERTGVWELNVTDESTVQQAVTEIAERFGRIDYVVSSAGIASGGPVRSSEPTVFDRVIEVNLLGSIRVVRAALPHLIESKGYALQIASLAAMMPNPTMAAYCASKAGVEAFCHALRGEVQHHGVEIGVGYLTWTDTDMVRGSDEDTAMATSRRELPIPFRWTYPLSPAVDRLEKGILGRKAHVYGQWWVRYVQLMRPFLPIVMGWVSPKKMPRIEKWMLENGSGQTPVGAGGAADLKSRLG